MHKLPAGGTSSRQEHRNTRLSLRLRREYLRPPRSEGRVGSSHQRRSSSQPEGTSPSYLRPPSSGAGTNLGASGRTVTWRADSYVAGVPRYASLPPSSRKGEDSQKREDKPK